jgi:hypothetical protein
VGVAAAACEGVTKVLAVLREEVEELLEMLELELEVEAEVAELGLRELVLELCGEDVVEEA